MTIETDLYDRIRNDSAVAALVSTRIFPHVAPTSAILPYITYNRVATVPQHHLLAATAISNATFQVNAWSEDSLEVINIAESIREALDGFRGLMGGTFVNMVHFENRIDDFDEPTDGRQLGTFRIIQDLEIWHVQTVPTFT